MTPHPIIVRKLERRGDQRLVHVDEVVRDETIARVLSFDERTFIELERVFSAHPFSKRSASDDIVLFRSLDTPLGEARKFLGFLIVNGGSRRHVKIEASEEAFGAMKTVLDSWSARFKNA